MEIVSFTHNFLERWDNFVASIPYSTIYHDSAWINLLQETFSYKQKGFLLLKGEDILGGLLLFEVKGFKGRRLVSSPFRDRGGLLLKQNVDSLFLINKAIQLLQEGGYDYLLIKEADPFVRDIVKDFGFKESTRWVTTRVDLTVGSDVLWKNLDNNAKGPVRQAEKYGLTVYCGGSSEDMDVFYNIFLRTRKALGIPSFPRSFFRNIWEKMCLTKKARLFLAKKDSLPVAGIILLLYKDTVIDGYAASLPELRYLRANDILIWRSLQWSAEEGYRIFDFGADSFEQEGLLAFKRKWCGMHKSMHHYFLLNKAKRINEMNSSEGKYFIMRKVISRLPLPLFSLVSEKVVPYLG